MKENGVIRRRLSGKEADPYIGLGRKILGEMKNIMQMGGIKQLNWTKDLQNGVRIVVSSIMGQDEVRIFVPVMAIPKIAEELTKKIKKVTLESRLWLFASNGSVHIINPNTGSLADDQSQVTHINGVDGISPPAAGVLIIAGKVWSVKTDYGSNADYLRGIDYLTGETVSVTSRHYTSPEGNHTYTLTPANGNIIWAVGRVQPQIFSTNYTTGLLNYAVSPVSSGGSGDNWLGSDCLSGVNNGTVAAFSFSDTGGTPAGVLVVDIATGSSTSYDHTSNWFESPVQGYGFTSCNFVMGNDGCLYGIAIRTIAAAPYSLHQAIKISLAPYTITVLADIGDYAFNYGEFNLNSSQLHISVSNIGLAFIASEFKYVIVDTNNGSIVNQGDTIGLLGLTVNYDLGAPRVNERLHGNGVILTDRPNSTVSFGIGLGQHSGYAYYTGKLDFVHIDLSTVQVERVSTGINSSYSSDKFCVEYLGEEDEDGLTPEMLIAKNPIYNDQIS